MIIFENPGILEPELISTFGASVKSDGAIGYFGTGLKFAIATLLRNEQKVYVITGGERYNFWTKKQVIRDKEFELVMLNDHKLGFTTELGKDWQLWMAYRELYCNALDERGHVMAKPAGNYEPPAGYTWVVVEGELIETEHNHRASNFIIGRQAVFQSMGVEIYKGEAKHQYYKGIRVKDMSEPSIYTYNFTDKVELTEDRTLKSGYDYRIAYAILDLKDKDMLKTILTAPSGTLECGLDFAWLRYAPSNEFLEVGLELYKDSLHRLNESAQRIVREYFQQLLWEEVTLSRVQSMMLAKAKDWAKFVGFECTYPIKVVETLGSCVLALADRKTKEIIISVQVFDKGTKVLCQAIIEEVIHLREGLNDKTRELQTFLFQKIMSMAEELKGEPI